MNKLLHQPLKTVLISSLVSANVIIWHGILGVKFLLAIVTVSLLAVLTSKTENA